MTNGPRLRLSPYCVFWLTPDGKIAHLVHGLYGSRFELDAGLLGVLLQRPAGASLDEFVARAPEGAGDALRVLVEERALIQVDVADILAASDPFRHRLDPLELAFHRGVNEGGYFADDVDAAAVPPPAKARRGGAIVALPVDTTGPAGADLAGTLARRRSIRRFGTRALPLSRFAKFLGLAARAFALRDVPGLGSVSQRRYPSAGARYPLEIYPVVYSVDPLLPGLYHYRPFEHSLEAVDSAPELRRGLLDMACHRMGPQASGQPSVLLLVTAVFARTCWKYRGMPYHAILLEAGALYQTMYLAATALGLAPCAIGAFPEIAVAELLGIDTRDEAQVGIFALGTVEEDAAASRSPIVALREDHASPLAAGEAARAIEVTFADDAKEVHLLAGLSLEVDSAGQLRCRFVERGDAAPIADRCQDEARRLLDHQRQAGNAA